MTPVAASLRLGGFSIDRRTGASVKAFLYSICWGALIYPFTLVMAI